MRAGRSGSAIHLVGSLLFVAVATSSVEAQAPAIPAPYHSGDRAICSDCHTMHFSQAHEWASIDPVAATGALEGNWLGGVGPNAHLLKAPSTSELCLACHDGLAQAPDVMTNDVNGLVERAAGFFPEPIDIRSYRGHDLGSDPDAGSGFFALCMRCHFGGSMATAWVGCTDCHAPHGRQSWRNLQWASDPDGTPQITAFTNGTGMEAYERGHVRYTAPPPGDGSWREVSSICTDCHHVFSGPHYTTSSGNGLSPYDRHPVLDTERLANQPIDKPGANTAPANWVAGGPYGFSIERLPYVVVGARTFAEADVVSGQNQPFCLSCHKAHGSENPFSLRWSGSAMTGCQQCHGLK